MLAVAGVITDVNDHMDERFARLEQLLEVKTRVDKIHVLLAEQFGRDVPRPRWLVDPNERPLLHRGAVFVVSLITEGPRVCFWFPA